MTCKFPAVTIRGIKMNLSGRDKEEYPDFPLDHFKRKYFPVISKILGKAGLKL